MKKFSILFLSMFFCFAAMAEGKISFKETEHNFGKVKEVDGDVTHEFKFTNTGDSDLLITNVQVTCGCTTPDWTKTPVEPGKEGKVSVKYSTKNRPGRFAKTITISTNNTDGEKTKLTIKGEVIPAGTEE